MTMDCQHARQLIDAAGRGGETPELRAAVEHLDDCAACGEVTTARERFDARVSAAMADVPIPMGLQQRLLTALAAQSPLPAPAALPASAGRHWPRRLMLIAATLLMLLGWYWQRPQALPLPLDELYTQLDRALFPVDGVSAAAEPFDASFNAAPPDAEWRDAIARSAPQGVDLDPRPGHDAAAYRFAAGRVSGWLLVLPRDRVANPPVAALPTHDHLRYGPRPQVAWSSDEYVYICVLERGTLDDLRRQFYGSAA